MFNPNPAFLLVQISPKRFTLGVKADEIQKKTFQSAPSTNKMLNFYGLVLAPRLKKRVLSNLGGRFASFGADVPAFINILTSMF